MTSLSEEAQREDAELVRDHCDPNCPHGLAAAADPLQNASVVAVWLNSLVVSCDTRQQHRGILTEYIFYFILLFLPNNYNDYNNANLSVA